ncbi:sensor histidine kinase [Paenibacillus sp. GCM10023252]|uniref:sensor histidine kinase n=1 Tax=Paenibacillus sp. GCM10023252 TaxID=3252649 RepID=UPI003609514F
MRRRSSIFIRMLGVVMLLTVPTLLLYTYSNQTNIKVIEQEIESTNQNQLSFLLNQMETEVNHLALLAVMLSRDSSFQQTQIPLPYDSYDLVTASRMIEEKLRLQNVSSKWRNYFLAYIPENKILISSSGKQNSDSYSIPKSVNADWTYMPEGSANWKVESFHQYVIYPTSAYQNTDSANLIIEVSFSADNLRNMLAQFHTDKQGGTLLFKPYTGKISPNPQADFLENKLLSTLSLKDQDATLLNKTVSIDGQTYLVNVMPSPSLDWLLIDYSPLEQILNPIAKGQTIFYSSITIMLLLAVISIAVLYRQVQQPIRRLVGSVKKISRGDYSSRLHQANSNEFEYLFMQFDKMSIQIQDLIEKVYKEELRSKEAVLKQLQSQINPHFLYNCLFYIMNMSALGDDEAVQAMASNLGKYYKYTTRVDQGFTTIKDELALVHNYLTIQSLRLDRFATSVTVPESMQGIQIPRLLLQPLVENAIIHGLEPKDTPGQIEIIGEFLNGIHRLSVIDNGIGMNESDLTYLQASLEHPAQLDHGYGVWNVHQRMIHHFGRGAGLEIASLKEGMRFTLYWQEIEEEE